MTDRLPVTVVIEGETITLGTIEVVNEDIEPREVLVHLGVRTFTGTLTGAPWNVFVLREEI